MRSYIRRLQHACQNLKDEFGLFTFESRITRSHIINVSTLGSISGTLSFIRQSYNSWQVTNPQFMLLRLAVTLNVLHSILNINSGHTIPRKSRSSGHITLIYSKAFVFHSTRSINSGHKLPLPVNKQFGNDHTIYLID